ncbi:MAG: efflux RND transporter periplasmic adaptor subunit [Desulfobacterales bacterium]|nr:efflux RND transporter periplasmic adaptor subunit [Desulfobacterales bacterium]
MTTPKLPKKNDKKWLFGLLQLCLVILFLGGALLLNLYLSSLELTPETEIRQQDLELVVETVVAEPQTHRLSFTCTGTVQVRAMTHLVPQVSGRITSVDDSAFPGGFFSENTLLFQIEKIDYKLALERIKAEVARAKTQLKIQKAEAKTAVAEWQDLHPDRPVPPLVAKKPQLREARANLAAAEARLKKARLDLSRTQYRLPFSGRITEFQMEEGQYVVAGQSYGQAYRLKSLEIDVPLQEQKFEWVMAASEPEIKISKDFSKAPVYKAHIKRVAGKLDPETRFSRIILGLEEKAPELLPDAFVHARITGPEKKDVWVLPLNTLQKKGRIWVVAPDRTLRSIHPEIIQITDKYLVAESDGTPIRAVQGNLPEATQGTRVRLVSRSERGSDSHGK